MFSSDLFESCCSQVWDAPVSSCSSFLKGARLLRALSEVSSPRHRQRLYQPRSWPDEDSHRADAEQGTAQFGAVHADSTSPSHL